MSTWSVRVTRGATLGESVGGVAVVLLAHGPAARRADSAEAGNRIADRSLAGNSIGAAGAEAIAEALKVNKTVMTVFLSGERRAPGEGATRGGRPCVMLTVGAGRGDRHLDRRRGRGCYRGGAEIEHDGLED